MFANLLLEKNRGSIVRLEYYDQMILEEENHGCHLKGPYGGVLLCAVSLHANNGLFSIAFAIVGAECRDSWSFFLNCLHDALEDDRYTIMSDRQKGLTRAVSEYFPNSWHRHCSKHLLNNFKAKYPLLILQDLFWMAVKAPNEFLFKKAMEKMKTFDNNAYQYLMDIPLHTWSTHAFYTNHKSPHITNNVCESFNAWIDNLRSMTVLKLVDGLRVKIMMRFYTQFSSTASWSYNVGPRIATEINKTTEDARYCKVYDGFTRFPVNLVLHTCECKAWQISGLPCKHGAAAIIYIREKVENYCDAYYHKDKYIIAYFGLHSPLPDLDTLDDTNVFPPPLRRLPGRPRKSRIREKDEDAPSNARRISTVRCSNCKDLGHNRKGCQRAPVRAKKARQEISASESQTSMIKQTQQHASAQAKAKSQLQAKQIKRDIRKDKLLRKHSSNLTIQ
ncbi:uncharacterized protein [Arachis hypogaea]|uniref:uncharacterized protein n=1 Tax=Arachis hypogaea TaxID=3818 RepID=UPI000DEC83FD|nr:uncharacterized protein LOC112718082 [Arachis hypogaea]